MALLPNQLMVSASLFIPVTLIHVLYLQSTPSDLWASSINLPASSPQTPSANTAAVGFRSPGFLQYNKTKLDAIKISVHKKAAEQ